MAGLKKKKIKKKPSTADRKYLKAIGKKISKTLKQELSNAPGVSADSSMVSLKPHQMKVKKPFLRKRGREKRLTYVKLHKNMTFKKYKF